MPAVTTINPTPAPTVPKPQGTTNIPYEVAGQNTPLIPAPKPVTSENLQQGSNQVMQAAQQTALNKVNQPNETMGLVQQNVQKMLKNPMGEGYDSQKYKQNQLEQYDRNRAQAMAAFQQQSADVANTGVNKEAAYNFAMQGAQGRSDAEQKLMREQQDAERAAMVQSLGLGQDVSKTVSGLDDAAFNRLISARGAFEGERSQTQGFKDTVELTNMGYDHDTQMAAINNGYDLAKMDKTFGQETATMIATQGWQSAENKIKNDLALAMQNNDIEAATKARQDTIELEKWKINTVPAATVADITSRLEIAKMGIASDEKIQADKNALTLQGLTIEEAKVKGYTDPVTGKHVAGSAELAQQGMTLDQAKVYGYEDPVTGEHVMGQSEIAAKSFGLQAKSLEDQEKELFGYDDPLTGKHIAGKIENMSASQKLAAESAYGYTDPVTGKKVRGSIENSAISADVDAARAQAEEDALKGYVDEVTGERVKGSAELAGLRAGIDAINAKLGQDALYGYDVKNADGTIKHINGSAEMAAAHFGLESKTLADQEKELFGYTADIGDGQGYAFHPGKLASMNAADKRAADELYGYFDTNAMPPKMVYGTLQMEKYKTDTMASLEQAGIDLKKTESAFAQLQLLVESGQADPSVLTQFTSGVLAAANSKLPPDKQVTITVPPPNASQIAAKKTYDDMVYQYSLTHPENVVYTAKINLPGLGKKKGDVINKATYDRINAANPAEALANFNVDPKTENVKEFNEFFNSSTYGQLTPEERAAKENAGYLTGDDLGGAGEGDKFNLTKEITYAGQKIPAGKYTTSVKTINHDQTSKTGAYTETQTILTNASTGATYKIKSENGTKGKSGTSQWAQFLANPLGGF